MPKANPSAGRNAPQVQEFSDRGIDLLQQIVDQGFSDANRLKSDVQLASLHVDRRFVALLDKLEPSAGYAAVSRADVAFESKLLAAIPINSSLEQVKALIGQSIVP